MKKLLASILVVVMILVSAVTVLATETKSTTAAKITFKDVTKDTPGYDAIYKLANAGIVNGHGDGTFKPNDSLTRAELTKIINLTFGYTEKAIDNFNDVKKTDWYYDYTLVAKKAGYIVGFPDGSFGGEKPLTREQVCTVINRCAELMPIDLGIKITDEVSDWAQDAVNKIVSNMLMPLEQNNTFRATKNITRAELAQAVVPFVVITTPENKPSSGGSSSGNSSSSGGNTSGGNTSGDNTSGGDATGGNTSGDNNTGGDTSGGNTSGDNTTGEDTSGGNTSGDNTSGGNTSGGNTTGGETSGGNTSGDNTSGGNTSGGNTTGGDTSDGNTSGDNTSGGNTSGGNISGGNTSGGNTSGGNTSGGNTSGGNTSGGSTSGGNTSGGNTSGGSTSGGNTSGGNTTGGNTGGDDSEDDTPTFDNSEVVENLNEALAQVWGSGIRYTPKENAVLKYVRQGIQGALSEAEDVELTKAYIKKKYSSQMKNAKAALNQMTEDQQSQFYNKLANAIDIQTLDFLNTYFLDGDLDI